MIKEEGATFIYDKDGNLIAIIKLDEKSRKKIICGNNIYESHYDRNERKNENDLFVDLDWLMLYNGDEQS